MAKRKSKIQSDSPVGEESSGKKQKKMSSDDSGRLDTDFNTLGNKQKKNKAKIIKETEHSVDVNKKEKKMKKKSKTETVKHPLSMQDLLAGKLKKVQESRLEKISEVKTNTDGAVNRNLNQGNVERNKDGPLKLFPVLSDEQGLHKKVKKRKESIFEETEMTSNDVNEIDPDEDPEKAAIRKKKREKRKQKKLEKEKLKQANLDRAGTAKVAAVEYLKQWKNNRAEWKFLKVRQVWLLQNIYNTELLDDNHFAILLEYLEGLKGRSREQTVSAAENILEKAEENNEDSDVKYERARQIIQLLSDG